MTNDGSTSGDDTTYTDATLIEEQDVALLADLGHALDALDTAPEAARLAAHGLLSWRSMDDELAELQFDSALDTAEVRGLAWPRQLSFEAAESSVEIEIDGHHIVGQIIPPAEVEVRLTSATGSASTTRSDSVGHFRFDDVGAGAIRITATLPNGTITTQWFSL